MYSKWLRLHNIRSIHTVAFQVATVETTGAFLFGSPAFAVAATDLDLVDVTTFGAWNTGATLTFVAHGGCALALQRAFDPMLAFGGGIFVAPLSLFAITLVTIERRTTVSYSAFAVLGNRATELAFFSFAGLNFFPPIAA